MAEKTTQAKVAQQSAGLGAGATLGIIIAWVLGQYGVEMPAEVSIAVGSVLGGIVQELSALVGAWKNNA